MGLTKSSTGMKVLSRDKVKESKNTNYEIGLAGNPNVGKSTVFNAFTGLNQHTGNWPGKTVANAEGTYEFEGKRVNIVDLPGTYSLLSNSEEEEIARDYVCFGNPDLVVVVADATSLERNLNLFFQISEMTEKVVLCVNLIDEAKKKGIVIDEKRLSNEIGASVVMAAARQNEGIEDLKKSVIKEVENRVSRTKEIRYDDNIEEGIIRIKELIQNNANIFIDEKKLRWASLRLLEGNEGIIKSIIDKFEINDEIISKINEIKKDIDNRNIEKNIEDAIVKTLVKKAEEVSEKVVKVEGKYDSFHRKVDKLLVSKGTGIPIMIILLLVILWITITLANYPSQLLASGFGILEDWIRGLFTSTSLPTWVGGILIDGIYVTLAWVISVMLPPMAIFFPMFTLLEDLGYLPRIAFNLDKCFKRCCSCGKQALTMCMGLGCNAAGVIGCRIINSPRERLIAILTNVFMPCNGRFPTLITIATIFIGGSLVGGIGGSFKAALAVTVIIILGVFMTLIVSRILSKTVLKGIPSNFILELPPYRKPQIGKVLIRSILDRTLYVLGRAIAVAAPAGVVIWIFANVPVGEISLLTYCADFLNPFANEIGLDGYILMAFILGLPANEIVMPIIIMSYVRASTLLEMGSMLELKELLVANGWTLLTAINMMIICLMHYPCGTTLWTIKKETKSWKWTILSFLIPTVAGIALCFITTQVWRLFG
ncbi:ferrous iron transport protein B [Clostridium paraputrificum]|uniref:ferrous iron transport protein B n=1 Tax=Clostridium paraputrificum TaxID=29363 RepID=UPI003D333317